MVGTGGEGEVEEEVGQEFKVGGVYETAEMAFVPTACGNNRILSTSRARREINL